MAITLWPEDDRPREKLMRLGASALSDAELLAIFLRTGVPGKTAVDIARELIDRFGGLHQLMGVEQSVFCQIKGLGEAKFAQLQAILEMAQRCIYEPLKQADALTSPQVTRRYLLTRLQHRDREVFSCLFLDSQHKVIVCEDLSQGTLDSTVIYPREVVRQCLRHNAAAVIFAHNHPSGNPEPSDADRHITRRLIDALGLFDIRVLDHWVVAAGRAVSMAERGLL